MSREEEKAQAVQKCVVERREQREQLRHGLV
jgi:hypothetical protein